MHEIDLYNNFYFFTYTFNKNHYTDNRAGSPLHYFAYMNKGRCKIVSENKTIHIAQGDVFHIPKNLPYQSYWYGEDEISFLSLGYANLISHDCQNLDLQVIACPNELAAQISSIPPIGKNVSTKIIGDFCCAVAALLPYMTKANISFSEQVLSEAKNYLQSNPNCLNSQLAKECNISIPYLYKIFKNIENETPNKYRQKVLCHKAVELLTTTDKSIEEISTALNFSSSSYFRKIFKECIGTTPREVRKKQAF